MTGAGRAEAILRAFEFDEDQVAELMPLCADLATFLGCDPDDSACMIGRSAIGKPRALHRRIGEWADQLTDSEEPYAATVALLRLKVGGYADAVNIDKR